MLVKLKQLDTAFVHLKFWTLLLLGFCLGASVLVVWFSLKAVRESKQEIYLISQDQVLKAFANPRDALVGVEAKSHLKQFHQLLFTLSPDEKLIERQLAESLYLGDQSVKFHLDNLRETGYFKKLLAANVSQRVSLDSIQLDETRENYPFSAYGKQEIIRSSSVLYRSLVTSGNLRPIQRTPTNPHGFLIENWEIIENRDLYQKAR
jgi:conjugative transposon TraK protein